MFTRKSVFYVCGWGYHVKSCLMYSLKVCYIILAGVTMFNEVLYVHKKKCVIYMWQGLPCLMKCYVFTRGSYHV